MRQPGWITFVYFFSWLGRFGCQIGYNRPFKSDWVDSCAVPRCSTLYHYIAVSTQASCDSQAQACWTARLEAWPGGWEHLPALHQEGPGGQEGQGPVEGQNPGLLRPVVVGRIRWILPLIRDFWVQVWQALPSLGSKRGDLPASLGEEVPQVPHWQLPVWSPEAMGDRPGKVFGEHVRPMVLLVTSSIFNLNLPCEHIATIFCIRL